MPVLSKLGGGVILSMRSFTNAKLAILAHTTASVRNRYAQLGYVPRMVLFFIASEVTKMLVNKLVAGGKNISMTKSIMVSLMILVKKAILPIAWVTDSFLSSINKIVSAFFKPTMILGPLMVCKLEGSPGKIVRHKGGWWLIEGDGYYTRVSISGGKFNYTEGEESGYISNQDVTATHETVTHFADDESPGECALTGVSSNGVPTGMAKGSCLVFVRNDRGELVHFSSCTVLENCLCICRHKLDAVEGAELYLQSKIVQNGQRKMVKIPFSRLRFLDKKIEEHLGTKWSDEELSCSAFDFAAAELIADELSMLGISSWTTEKNIQRSYAGKMCKLTYAVDEFNTFTFTGNVPQKDAFAHELGLGLARVHSVKGASSSPLVLVDESLKLGGMWLGKPTRSLEQHQGVFNVFMTVDCMIGNLRTLGLFKCPLAEKIKNICDKYQADLIDLKFPGETSDMAQSDDGRDPDEYFGATKRERREMRNAQKASASREDQRAMERAEQDRIVENLHGESKETETTNTEVQELKELVKELVAKVQPTPPGLEKSESQFTHEEQSEVVKGKDCGHAKDATVSTGKLGPCMTEEERLATLARIAMEVASQNEQTYIQTKCLLWKNSILQGEAEAAFEDIAQWVTDTVDNADSVEGSKTLTVEDGVQACRQRIHLILNAPCNILMKEYLKKTVPQWGENVENGDLTVGKNTIVDMEGNPYFEHVGTTNPGHTKKPKVRGEETPLQADFRKLAEKYHADGSHGCTKGRFEIPQNSKDNIEASMRAQAAMTFATRPPIFERSTFVEEPWCITEKKIRWEAAVKAATGKYEKAMGQQGHTTILTHLEEGQLGFYKVFLGLQQSSSGATSRFLSDTKKNWVKEHPEEAIDLAITRLILIAACGNDIQYLSSIQMVDLGLKDVQDVFLKGELHSPKKMKSRRYRLIWISSLIDIIVQSLLHKADNAYFTEAYQKGFMNSSATGLGHDDRGVERMIQAFHSENLENHNVSCDATAFDLSIDYEFIRADAERRADVVRGEHIGNLIVNFSFVLARHVLNNNGDVWSVEKFGVTTSGMISTTAQNTFSRGCQAAYAGCLNWVCSGDDLVADFRFDSDSLWEDLQIATREEKDNFGTTEFTSHKIAFDERTAAHLNTEKLLWTLHHKVVDTCNNPNRLGAVLHVLRNTPGVREDVKEIVDRHAISVEGKVIHNEDALRDFD